MKIIVPSTPRRQEGVALLITIVILLFVGATLATYLVLTEGEYNAVGRSQVWNGSMTLTEAGIEDALAFINQYAGNVSMVNQWPTTAAQNGWSQSGALFTMTRVMDTNSGSYYTVTIDDTITNAPKITSTGYAYWNYSALQPAFMLASAGVSVSSGSAIGRTVVVQTSYKAIFPDAIDAKGVINLNGNNVTVNSFDSANPLYSDWTTNGYGTYDMYNSLKWKSNGNVSTDSGIVGAISVGQANIYGKVNTGPGGTATIGNNGYVGPYPTGSGITPGWSSDDMNVIFPDVQAPSTSGWANVPSNNTITNSAGGNYYTTGINSSLYINTPGTVNIYVAGSVNLSGNTAITLGTSCTKVNIYVVGSSFDITGNSSINNLTQHASVLAVWGLPTLTDVTIAGNGGFTGTLYAPEANFTIGGGGNNTYDFVGAIIVNAVTLKGHAHFHYDESLSRNGPARGYIPTSWTETTGN